MRLFQHCNSDQVETILPVRPKFNVQKLLTNAFIIFILSAEIITFLSERRIWPFVPYDMYIHSDSNYFKIVVAEIVTSDNQKVEIMLQKDSPLFLADSLLQPAANKKKIQKKRISDVLSSLKKSYNYRANIKAQTIQLFIKTFAIENELDTNYQLINKKLIGELK